MCRPLCSIVLVSLLASCYGPHLFAQGQLSLSYQQQIRPILVEHCLACHGVDQATRQGGLRLDQRDGAIGGGDSNRPAIVPGKPDESELLRRITSTDADEVMPPRDHAAPLNQSQIELLRAWIAGGAAYEEHWAFVPPQQVELASTTENPTDTAHPIDVIVKQHLSGAGLTLSEPESPNILCRRLYLDLIGLPPTPAQLREFESVGLVATVDQLLSSERFGEKWARPWLDAARYSDTNGYEKDLKRDQWAWRDWVIHALNTDMPYDQFIIEQIAGDLLPEATQDQLIATGFLRNSMINEEGAIVPEQFRMVEMFDRMDCIGKSILGLTTQCAQCHSHKFDPLTQHEFYQMFAFLNNTYEAQSWVYTAAQQTQRLEVLAALDQIRAQIKSSHPTWPEDVAAFAEQLNQQPAQWQPITFDDMNSISGLNHPTQEADLSLLMKGHTSADVYFIGEPSLEAVTGLQLELLTHADLPFKGPGRNSVGSWGVREVELFIQPPDAQEWQKVKLVNATADYSEAEQKHDEGKNTSGPVSLLIDGQDNSWWKADRGVHRRNTPSVAVMQLESPLSAPKGTRLKIAMRMTDMVGCCRFSLTQSANPVAAPVEYAAVQAANLPEQQRSPEQNQTLFDAWCKTVAALKPLADQIESQWQQYPVAETSILHAAERPDNDARSTHLLDRGEWDKPQANVTPGVPAAFHPLRDTAEPPRLRFARWLVDRQSPLAARVAVNRIWQSIFGLGLVETAEDFGTRTPVPEYHDLLDWLAVDFMEHRWSTKHLLRVIVTSRTYQQSSRTNAHLMELDPDNRLLARGPRFRADAEVIRDLTMAIAGIMHHQLGGPAVIPPVPQNVLDYNYTYPSYWKPAEGPERYRRTLYNFRKRSMPDPAMSAFDAPNADSACARRVRSNTPLAALTALNEPIFVESAQALALRILRDGGANDTSRIQYAYQLCTARLPTATELEVLSDFLQAQRQRIADGWLDAREVATGKPGQLPALPPEATPQDAAAWTLAARVMLNLDETICKN